MINLNDNHTQEKAVLAALQLPGHEDWEIEDDLQELAELARTAGARVVAHSVQRRKRPDPACVLGRGKIEDIKELAQEHNADLVIFDFELTPAQQRNIEKIINIKTVDRTQLILDIFAQHAHTRDGKLQIELAQLVYLLPRLVGKGIMLSRLGGGIGTRGPGEQKLEVDRRRIRERINRLQQSMKQIQRHRSTQRKQREKNVDAQIAIVGYTNAGKSSLLNALCNDNSLVEDILFATLDPRTRRLTLPNNQDIVLTDTVGFIKKLPHTLVDGFRATLEEVTYADILIHVVDVNHPHMQQRIDAVYEVLSELGAADKPIISVYNKIDLLSNKSIVERLAQDDPNSIACSIKDEPNLSPLINIIVKMLQARRLRLKLNIPHNQTRIVAAIHERGKVLSQSYSDNYILIEAEVDSELAAKLKPFIANHEEK